jgi:lipopolysaccharide cholinephosphotransferase
MPRKDYDKLINLYKEGYFDAWNRDWALISQEIHPQYWQDYAKFSHKHSVIKPRRFNNKFEYGLSIDIFPLDGIYTNRSVGVYNFIRSLSKESRERAILDYRDSYFRKKQNLFLYRNKAFFKRQVSRLLHYLIKPFSKNYSLLYEEITYVLRSADYEKNDQICCFAEKDVFEKSWFEPACVLEFEGYPFKAPHDFDSILKKRYGDYMTLPDPNLRRPTHSYKAYYL